MITNTYDGSLPKTVTSTGTLAQTLAFAFNNDLRLTGFTYAGATNNFAYDNDGLLTSSGRFVMTRNAQNGLPTAMTGGALNLSRTFNGFGEVTTQSQTVNGTAAGSWMVTYNNNGQIATKTETVAGITANYVYTYDATGRLTQVAKDNALVEEYRYTGANPLGTRTYEMNSLRGIAGRSLSYNAEDQIVSVGSTTYQFDTDGFLSRKTDGSSITTYNYSSGGELLSTALPDGRTIAYVYDPLGRRIAKKINGVILEKYLWSGLTQLLAVYDGSDNLVMRFEYADGRVPNVMTKGGQTYYLTYDQVGSLRAVANSTGSVVKRIDYDSFGNIIADSAPTFVVPFGFAGGLHDRDIDLVHFGFRDYDPATGRWTAKDPIGFDGGDVDLYGYVLNDPVNLVDPTGLYWLKDLSDFSAGLGDALLLGTGQYLRDLFNINGVNPCSIAYRAGSWSSFALGAARLGYAGLAKVGSMVAPSGLKAAAFREGLKNFFRFGSGKNWRPPNLSKYPTDDALKAAAGRTNPYINTYGAGVSVAGAAGGSNGN